MLGLLKNLLGGSNKPLTTRTLRHPRDLRTGDIIRFKFLDQSALSGQQFEVAMINTYVYDQLWYLEYVLKDATGNLLYLMVEEEDGEEYLAISQKVRKSAIGELFSADQLQAAMEGGIGSKIELTGKPEGLQEWLKRSYRKVDNAVQGAFVRGDAREISEVEFNRQEHFVSHVLVSKNDEFALEFETYNGETELSATVYHDINEIDEMWPSA